MLGTKIQRILFINSIDKAASIFIEKLKIDKIMLVQSNYCVLRKKNQLFNDSIYINKALINVH